MTKGTRIVHVTQAMLDESMARPMKTDLPDDVMPLEIATSAYGWNVTCESAKWSRLAPKEAIPVLVPKLTLRELPRKGRA